MIHNVADDEEYCVMMMLCNIFDVADQDEYCVMIMCCDTRYGR